MQKVISAGGIVWRKKDGKDEICFIKDSYGRYAFPKGHVERGENEINAATREVEEEAGLTHPDVIADLGELKYCYCDKAGRDAEKNCIVEKSVHFFLMKASPEAEYRPQKEEGITEIKWTRVEEAESFAGYENIVPIIKKAIAEIKKSSGI